MPVEMRHELEKIRNVHVVALPPPDAIDLSWKDVHNVAAVITITCGLTGLPGQISEIATMLTDYAVSQPAGCTYVIEVHNDNLPIIVRNTDEGANLLQALNDGIMWEND
jgi:hypothetical protein